MKVDFKHIQSAHCENGVTSNLLQHYGVPQMTEPLAFGIGSGLFYIHIPFLKINHGPAIAFRTLPGLIFKRTCKSLNIPIVSKTFSSSEAAEKELTSVLAAGKPVGCQVGVYYLSYFPKEYRFHFNAHNLIVYGKEQDTYLISDPVMEEVTTLSSFELDRVRFAKGALAPKGKLYYPKANKIITDEDIRRGIVSGIKRNVRDMLRIPGSFVGVAGIKGTGQKIKKWKDTLGLEKSKVYLAQLVRMQEEIGTGGGGFRFIYAAFLQQAHQFLPNEELLNISKQFTQAGDIWRQAAVQAAGIYKGRIEKQEDFNLMCDYLEQAAAVEKQAFQQLDKIKWKK